MAWGCVLAKEFLFVKLLGVLMRNTPETWRAAGHVPIDALV
jgi:hypothetical protein